MTNTMPYPPHEQPGLASAEAGQVLLDGPDGVAVSMTPDCAEETGRRLIDAAEQARQQDVSAAG